MPLRLSEDKNLGEVEVTGPLFYVQVSVQDRPIEFRYASHLETIKNKQKIIMLGSQVTISHRTFSLGHRKRYSKDRIR